MHKRDAFASMAISSNKFSVASSQLSIESKKNEKRIQAIFSLEEKCDGATKTHPLPLSLVVCCCAWALATLGLIDITRGLVQLPLERTYVPVKVLLWNVAFRRLSYCFNLSKAPGE